MAYDLTQVPDKLIDYTKEAAEYEEAMEEAAFVRDQMKYCFEAAWAAVIAREKGLKHPDTLSQAQAELETGAEKENLIQAEYRYKLVRAGHNNAERVLMTNRQLMRLVPGYKETV